MLTAAVLSAALTFTPFYVGPQLDGNGITHIFEYAATPEQGRVQCLAELRTWPRGQADCLVRNEDDGWVDASYPGWGRQFGPTWAGQLGPEGAP